MARGEAIPFDLRTLELFLAVCDQGSMAGAARHLGLTQPAVSLAISELESRTGTILFDRSVRPLGLTPAGWRAAAAGGRAHHGSTADCAAAAETERSRYPLLRVGLVDSLSRALSAPLGVHLMGLGMRCRCSPGSPPPMRVRC